MAPDRGPLEEHSSHTDEPGDGNGNRSPGEIDQPTSNNENAAVQQARQRGPTRQFLAEQADKEQNFTIRGTLVGLAIGLVICFSNTYFGLQTGWISGMAMPSALIGFAFFKMVARWIDYPFTPVENVLVTTVAGAVGTMPLGCGFVGVLPALNFLLRPEENGPLVLGLGKMILWAIGVCFFGVVFAVPLRREVIIREKLKFPSGTATALIIAVLHGDSNHDQQGKQPDCLEIFRARSQDTSNLPSKSGISPVVSRRDGPSSYPQDSQEILEPDCHETESNHRDDWKAKIRLLLLAFAISAVYTVVQFFIPQLRDLPVFGLSAASKWLWTLNPSPAYVGQGIIMGPATTFHMLFGAVLGWGILSPMARSRGWAPGAIDDWNDGSKGWILWVSLAIMLADSVVSLVWLLLRPLVRHMLVALTRLRQHSGRGSLLNLFHFGRFRRGEYVVLSASEPSTPVTYPDGDSTSHKTDAFPDNQDLPEPDAPASHLVSTRLVLILGILSVVVCVLAVRAVFGSLIPYYAILLAVLLALLLSLMGVRALGETDLNPVSGISKITQLVFAFVVPSSNPNAIAINLLAGAISESGALQAGDMMQDLKTGHLLGAAPIAQFYGQIIGSFFGAIASAVIYQLYTNVYEIPGGPFQVPTAYMWLFTAQLVTGRGLPPMAWQWALGAGSLFSLATALRMFGHEKWWKAWVPGGIAVAVGIFNVPSFTLARAIGGLVNWYWCIHRGQDETPVIVLASGLILGEGLMSVLNLLLANLDVPHL